MFTSIAMIFIIMVYVYWYCYDIYHSICQSIVSIFIVILLNY